ncbi:hypothetical protein GCM10027199_85320 [Amycolatopsis magusensis]
MTLSLLCCRVDATTFAEGPDTQLTRLRHRPDELAPPVSVRGFDESPAPGKRHSARRELLAGAAKDHHPVTGRQPE